jgi:hypothetical protein
MLESLTWQAAFAIVASVVTITIGVFGYLIKVKSKNNIKQEAKSLEDKALERIKADNVEIKERLVVIESEIKLLVQHGKNTNRRIDDHEEQDRREFTHLENKIDKLTDILMRILSDDKL